MRPPEDYVTHLMGSSARCGAAAALRPPNCQMQGIRTHEYAASRRSVLYTRTRGQSPLRSLATLIREYYENTKFHKQLASFYMYA